MISVNFTIQLKLRNGQLTRDEVLEVIQKDPYTGGLEALDYCLKKLDLSYNDFDSIMNEAPKSFRNYKSYYSLVRILKKPIYWGTQSGIVPDTVYKKYFSFDL